MNAPVLKAAIAPEALQALGYECRSQGDFALSLSRLDRCRHIFPSHPDFAALTHAAGKATHAEAAE